MVKTKRILPGVIYLVLVSAVFIFSIRWAINDTSKDFIEYINNDYLAMAQLETKMVDSYKSVTGANSTDDATAYTEIKNNTLPTAYALASKANTIYSKLSSKDIKKAQLIYINYINANCEAFELMLEALEKHDDNLVQNANAKLKEASMRKNTRIQLILWQKNME